MDHKLDLNVKDLHRLVLGSVSQQQQQPGIMDIVNPLDLSENFAYLGARRVILRSRCLDYRTTILRSRCLYCRTRQVLGTRFVDGAAKTPTVGGVSRRRLTSK
ncbi:unnamed protein product [Arabis nemorensis]|uniref:Uncharacterized protein n=1 Tax=Arabis nemorensis TaxID=586526 RepID=A0A565BM64_9BRAS|nr:unnamed protein product [Arabis nemorensis]